MNQTVRTPLAALIVGALFTAAVFLGGCGQEDLCADVDCDFGECDSQTGECENPEECRVADDCLAGYECSPSDYTCQAVEECSIDDDCGTGVCQGGACVNPETCEEDDDCVERTFCGPDGECEPDPCAEIDCQRGECNPRTLECESRDSCTPENEAINCIDGEKCADGECADDQAFCNQIECDRGVCSFEEGGCTNADDCQGSDQLCQEGYFCNDQDRCEVDLCEQNEIDCGDNGVCQPTSGECENARECQRDSDCLADHVCSDQTCRHVDSLCGSASGDGGCPGRMTCDTEATPPECEEPEECDTSFDCQKGRQCAGSRCMEMVECRDDLFEPNDSSDEAVDFHEVAYQNTLEATACQDDVDTFTVDSTELIDPSSRGTLFIELNVDRRNRGLGKLLLEITGPDGETRETSTGANGAESGARIQQQINVPEHGEYTVKVKADDDMTEAGVSYDLSVNLLPEATYDACQTADKLRGDQLIEGDTDLSESTFTASSCAVDNDESTELIYEYEVDTPQEIAFELEPLLSSADLSMSLRKECAQPASEVGCVDETEAGGEETLEALVEPGTYYLIVQSGAEGTGGPFELEVDSIYTTCGREGANCESEDESLLCSSRGGRYDSIECNEGCNPQTGRCFPPEGDTCLDAPVIEPNEDAVDDDEDVPDNRVGSFEEEIEFGQYTNEYAVSSDATCSEDAGGEPRNEGPDATYQVELPAETSLSAEVEFEEGATGSLYLLEDCSKPDESCEKAAVESTDDSHREELNYSNFSEDEDETFYLVVDTEDDQGPITADLNVTLDEVICEPEAEFCDEDENLSACNEWGTKTDQIQECWGLGCEDSACIVPDTCDSAVDLTSDASQSGGVVAEGTMDDLSHEIAWAGGCSEGNSIITSDFGGSDGVYSVDLADGETVTADLQIEGSSVYESIALQPSCGDIDDQCYDAHSTWSGGDTASVSHTASQDETVYIFADSSGSSSEDYTLEVTID